MCPDLYPSMQTVLDIQRINGSLYIRSILLSVKFVDVLFIKKSMATGASLTILVSHSMHGKYSSWGMRAMS